MVQLRKSRWNWPIPRKARALPGAAVGGRLEGGGEPAVQVLRRRLVAAEHDRVEQAGPDAGLGPPGDPEVFAVDDGLADLRRHVHRLRPFLIAQAGAEIGRVNEF
jgi:hypothetical protein